MSESGLKGVVGSENQSTLPLTEPLSPLVPQSEVDALKEECETLRQEVTRLHSALETEQAHRQQLEQECATERQRAESYYLDRIDYKQRLREAASAYSELKTAYRRVISSTPTKNNPSDALTAAAVTRITALTSIDATDTLKEEEIELDELEDSPTQTIPVEDQNCRVPLLTQAAPVLEGVDLVKEEVEEAVVDSKVSVEQSPLSYSPKHRPAWKKAQRTRKDAALLDHDDEEEDIFLQPPAKKWMPPNNRSSDGAAKGQQPRVPAARPPPPATTTTQEASRQQRQQQAHPLPNGGAFKYQEVIRKREDRNKLEGFECQDCKRFYDAMEKWGALGVLPQCQHHLNPNPGGGRSAGPSNTGAGEQQQAQQANLRNALRAGASRHRYLFEPPLTPNGFWDLGFSPPKETSSSQEEKEEWLQSPPSTAPPRGGGSSNSFQ